MQIIKSTTQNPYFNIATEEYLLRNCDDDILFFYINEPSVIIGKHQVYNLELNLPHITEHNIPVIRRISGGGSVFHDTGNLNYAIITSSKKAWVDFEKFTTPLIQHLKNLSLNPELRSTSDIRIAGKKISGNASHIYKNRVLHHGSILFSTDLDALTNCLKNSPTKYKNKSVQSRRSIVTNISSHLKTTLDIERFQEQFIQSLQKNGLITGENTLDENATEAIQKLINEKYINPEWNCLYNANYDFKNTFLFNKELLTVTFKVKKGICTSIQSSKNKDIEQLIDNVPHETSHFISALQQHFTEKEVLNYFF